MPFSDRTSYIPDDAVGRTIQRLDQDFQSANRQMQTAGDRLGEAGSYVVHHPVDLLAGLGDFIVEEGLEQWANIRDTYDAGTQVFNQISMRISSPCQDTWSIVIDTALPAAGDALWLFLIPSPGEILENFLEPAKLRKGGKYGHRDRHPRRKLTRTGRILRKLPRFPDVDQIIAGWIPGRQALKGRSAKPWTRWAFEGIDLADRVLWYYLIIDASKTFATEWSSGLRQAEFCSGQHTFQLISYYIAPETSGDEPLERSYHEAINVHNIQPALAGLVLIEGGIQFHASSGTCKYSLVMQPNNDNNLPDQIAWTLVGRNNAGELIDSDTQSHTFSDVTEHAKIDLQIDMTGVSSLEVFWVHQGPNQGYTASVSTTIEAD